MQYIAILGLLINFLLGCTNPSYSVSESIERIEPQGRISFVDKIGREYVFDFENSRSSLSDGHAGSILKDCSTEKYHCYRSDTIIVSPRDCSETNFMVDWAISNNLKLRFIAKDSKRDEFIFMTIRDESQQSSQFYGSDGFIFSQKRGVVGIWFSREKPSSLSQISNIFWLSSHSKFLPCT